MLGFDIPNRITQCTQSVMILNSVPFDLTTIKPSEWFFISTFDIKFSVSSSHSYCKTNWIHDAECDICAIKTYDLKGSQTESCSADRKIMDVQNEILTVGMAERHIKVEEEEAGEGVEGNGCNTPCSSGSPNPSLQSGAFYFPTQAVFSPRSSLSFSSHPPPVKLRLMQRLSNKRKTLAALTEVGVLVKYSCNCCCCYSCH